MSFYRPLAHAVTPLLLAFGALAAVHAADDTMSQPGTTGPGAAGSAGSSSYATDAAITAKVQAALASNQLSGISVTTEMGVVSLSGTVETEEMRQQATSIASSIEGVRGVDYTALSVNKMGS